MNYTVLLVGLTYFDPQGKGKRALMPDGRNPARTDPHIPSISVRSADLVSDSGWPKGKRIADPATTTDPKTEFFFDDAPSFIEFPTGGMVSSSAPPLNAADLDSRCIHLRDINKKFKLSDTPQIVASIAIEEGTIQALRVPNSPADGTAQIFAEWKFNDGAESADVTIKLTDMRDGKNVRTIVVKDGAEIAVVNTSRAYTLPGDHFAIYERISIPGATLRAPQSHLKTIPGSMSKHPVFAHGIAASGAVGCSPADPGGGG